ncbi:MAG: type II secretion system protein [Planctomycetota bacterium]|jgi:prepilin-type N-terminal cleavage/methylation domain-containing protein
MSDVMMTQCFRYSLRLKKAFTLIELLVVIAVIALLLGVMLPSLRKAKNQAKLLICASNLRNVGVAIHTYSMDFDSKIPFGPEGRMITGTNFYTSMGNVTSLLSLEGDGKPVGLGLLLDGYLSEQPKVLFCPGADQRSDAQEQLALVGNDQAQCDYYYRHASVALISGMADTFHIKLNDLGKNRNGRSISALVMDIQFRVNSSMPSIISRTNHDRQAVNILFFDNQVTRQDNSDDTYTVDIGWILHSGLDRILQAFEQADELRK